MQYKSEVIGKGNIVARVVAKSCNKKDKESVICTFELEYPRFIHSELMTHRLFSRNAMSSRAVPIKKMIEQVRNNPATPIHWGANQAGMQADKECNQKVEIAFDAYHESKIDRESAWCYAAEQAAYIAGQMSEAGYHKQIVNRILEPFQMMKTVLTATEFDNFFWLRRHADAQPEIKELADCMYQAYSEAEAEELKSGEWHTPYVEHFFASDGDSMLEYHSCNIGISSKDALKVSASCCAQVSYRVLDNSLDKALAIYDQLVDSKPVHASPFEHQAKPMANIEWYENGATHVDNNRKYWSGNLKGWVQYRQLISDNTCWDYQE